MNMKVIKNLGRRLWGYFVPFITSKWEVCVDINLNLIVVCDATTHSASLCSQSNTGHSQLWPCSAQLCAAGEAPLLGGEYKGSTGISPRPLFFKLCPSLVPHSWSAGQCKAGLLMESGRSSTFPLCGAQSAPAAVPDCRHPICWGWGVPRSSAGGRATARSFQRSGQVVCILL